MPSPQMPNSQVKARREVQNTKRMMKGFSPDYYYDPRYPDAGPQASATIPGLLDKGSRPMPNWLDQNFSANPAFPGAGPQASATWAGMGQPMQSSPLNTTGMGFGASTNIDMPQMPAIPQMPNQQPVIPGAQPAPAGAGGFDMAALIQALNAPRGRHLGMGGAEMTEANPMGNFGGDPFTNGFFKPQTPQGPMNVLSGSSNPDPGQLALLDWSANQGQVQANALPPGDPNARAFWATAGQPQPFQMQARQQPPFSFSTRRR